MAVNPIFNSNPGDADGFDALRDALLAALMSADWKRAGVLCAETAGRAELAGELSENDQKALYQVRQALRRFRDRIPAAAGDRVRSCGDRVRRVLAATGRRQRHRVQYIDYDPWRRGIGLPKTAVAVMMRTVSSLQLTVGCSGACRRCNEWALAGPRKHFTFEAAIRLIEELFACGNRDFSLYGASDPLDWRHGRRRISDLWEAMARRGHRPHFGLLTKIPPGSEAIFEKLIAGGADVAVSLCDRNRRRVAGVRRRLGQPLSVHHDVDELLIAAGRDEPFAGVRSSITDNYGTEITPEGAFRIVPTFTSALNLTGQRRTAVTSATTFFLRRRTGRRALPVEYFKPLAAIDLQGRDFTLDRLLDAQVENVLLDGLDAQAVPPGMIGLEEYLETFFPTAVNRRRRMAKVVLANLAREILPCGPLGRDAPGRRRSFRRRAVAYLDSCRLQTAAVQCRLAVSFLLAAVAGYLKRNQDRRRILSGHLPLEYGDRCSGAAAADIAALEHSDPEPRREPTFGSLRRLCSRLIENPRDECIRRFIDRHPAAYDPETDRFVPAQPPGFIAR